jgi:type I restriction enzyme S subunit
VLDLESRHPEEVCRILRESGPGIEVRAFGSRVRGGAKPHSDLDLVARASEPLPMAIKVKLEEAFSESRLPFEVDVLYWDEISESFRRLIEQGQAAVWDSTSAQPTVDR